MTETVEGEVIEERAVAVIEPAGLARARTPTDTIGLASSMATALADVVERQKLYSVINGKKFPFVEAWMTIGRMDNVVAREAEPPIRREDGSYEAFVELVRLSDGMIVGRASALCGTKDDVAGRADWSKRAEPARRSMAVTRATSRAFRQQYSWIMALAGYEPTPAEEMVDEPRTVSHPVAAAEPEHAVKDGPWSEGSLTTKGAIFLKNSAPGLDGELRHTADGPRLMFGLDLGDNKRIPQVVALGELAVDIHDAIGNVGAHLNGMEATVSGELLRVPWEKGGKPMRAFQRLVLARIETSDWTLPVPESV